MRKLIKTISSEPEKFIPKSHLEDSSLSENAKEIKDRPLVFLVRKMTREHKYNLQSLIDIKSTDNNSISNLGSAAKYIWNNCVLSVHNVLIDDNEFEKLEGKDKDKLFDTTGIDNEIMECVKFIQDISSLSEEEIKN